MSEDGGDRGDEGRDGGGTGRRRRRAAVSPVIDLPASEVASKPEPEAAADAEPGGQASPAGDDTPGASTATQDADADATAPGGAGEPASADDAVVSDAGSGAGEDGAAPAGQPLPPAPDPGRPRPWPWIAGGALALGIAVGALAAAMMLGLWQQDDRDRTAAALDAMAERLAAVEATGNSAADAVHHLEERLAQAAAGDGGAAELMRAVEDLRGEISVLAGRIEAVTGQLQDAGPAAGSGDLAARIDALDEAVNQLGRTVADSLQVARQDVQEARDDRARVTRVSTLAAAVLQLEQAVAGGEPFETPLAVLEQHWGSDPAIATLRPLAATGVASQQALAAELQAIREADGEGRGSDAGAATGDDGVGWFWDRLGGLVEVRRIDGAADGRLADAADRLAAGDLAGAVKAAEAVGFAADSPGAQWLERARQRLAAEDAARRLSARALAELAGAGGSR